MFPIWMLSKRIQYFVFMYLLYNQCLCSHHYDWLRNTAEAFITKTQRTTIIARRCQQQLINDRRRFCMKPFLTKQTNRIVTSPRSFTLSSTVTTISNITSTDPTIVTTIWNNAQIIEYANQQGVIISLSTLGPAYRAIARAKHNTSQIIGYIEGFIRPGNTILHLDKMEVYKKMIKLVRIENSNEFKGGGTILGVGLLLGYICLLHGIQNKCNIAEFLAIDDNEAQHKRLVKYYKTSGFQYVKYVGDKFQDIPDRLIWGGCGTLLRANNIHTLLQFWTTLLVKSIIKQQQQKSSTSTVNEEE